jgi:hypothetical protein
MTTKEEILKAYKEGFQDGWKMAREEMKDFTEKNNGKIYPDLPNIPGIKGPWKSRDFSYCPVCRRTGMTGVDCNIPNCLLTAYSYTSTVIGVPCTDTIGAAGSDRYSNLPLGANGPTGGDVK